MFEFRGLDKFHKDIDALKREMNAIHNKQWLLEIHIPQDTEGYIDRQCPNQECRILFKIHNEDWEAKCREQKEHCPICRYENKWEDFNTQKMKDHIDRSAKQLVGKEVNEAIKRALGKTTRHQTIGDSIQLSSIYKSAPANIVVTIDAYDELQQKAVCNKCNCRYATIGPAYCCPACGTDFITTTNLKVNIAKAERELELITSLKIHLEDSESQKFERSNLENVAKQLVTDFQTYAKAMFDSLPKADEFEYRKNAFQNLEESGKLWKRATGRSYKEMLNPQDIKDLNKYFQQRHLLEHNQGMVDQEYINKTGDQEYKLGHRIIITQEAIQYMIELIKRLDIQIENICQSIKTKS